MRGRNCKGHHDHREYPLTCQSSIGVYEGMSILVIASKLCRSEGYVFWTDKNKTAAQFKYAAKECIGINHPMHSTHQGYSHMRLQQPAKMSSLIPQKPINTSLTYIYNHIENPYTDAQLKVLNAVTMPTLMHGCETWSLSKQQQSWIQATQMNALRRIEGVHRLDRVRNVDIRKELQQEGGLDMTKSRQVKWKARLENMSMERTTKKILVARCRARDQEEDQGWNGLTI